MPKRPLPSSLWVLSRCTARSSSCICAPREGHIGHTTSFFGQLHAKHSVSYDRLPHWFCEFDVYDRVDGVFLSTPRRHALLAGSPVVSVPVLHAGALPSTVKALRAFVRPSLAKSARWRESFERSVERQGLDLALAWRQTDKSALAEGLYIKIENETEVLGRCKWVRPDFVQTILDSGSHHSTRPVIPNGLAAGADIYAPQPAVGWCDPDADA